jgi:16S rRNA (uracil1498-N3)-methyltransferase
LSRLNRFYIAGPHQTGATLQLDAERSNYVCRVLRMQEGDALDIFDGQGGLFHCALQTAHLKRAVIKILKPMPLAPQPTLAPTIALSLLKGQAMDRAIQQATELGVQRIWLLNAARSNITLKDQRLEQKLEHWRRIVGAACEQCGQLWLPEVLQPMSVSQCLTELSESVTPLIFDPSGAVMPAAVDMAQPLVFIGPEGGWSDAEMALFQQRYMTVYRLGDTILRAETMPAVALALVQQARDWRS